jgi:hypothetical protein
MAYDLTIFLSILPYVRNVFCHRAVSSSVCFTLYIHSRSRFLFLASICSASGSVHFFFSHWWGHSNSFSKKKVLKLGVRVNLFFRFVTYSLSLSFCTFSAVNTFI